MTIIRTFTNDEDRFAVNDTASYELTFLGGNDRLINRAGTTTAYMGDGDDFIRIEGGRASIFGQAGNDRFEIYASDSRVNGGGGNDTFVVGGGSNHVLVGRDGDDRFNITANADDVLIQGDQGNDIFYGHSLAIGGSISGGAGADQFLLFGNHGGRAVTLYGGAGSDLYRLDPDSPATIVEHPGEGIDTVQVADGVTYVLGDNLENLVVNGFAQVGEGVDLTGNNLSNRIAGSRNADVIQSSGGDDVLFGLGGSDYVAGGDGNDRIYGGSGVDEMHGEAGNDTFVYTSAGDAPYDPTWSNVDWIVDYDSGDRVDLSAIDANSDISGVQHFQVVEGDGHAAGTLHYEADPAGWGWFFVSGYIDGDDQPDIAFLITGYPADGYPPVTSDSFIVG